jgi:hypothetical protein
MAKIGRYSLSELSPKRVALALRTRLAEIPHAYAWKYSHIAKENRDRIRQFQGIHIGNRGFILANGPSLAKTNLELLKDEYTFGLNRFYLNFPNSSFRPTYYVTLNELVLEQFSHDIAELDMPKFINWNRRSLFNSNDSSIYYIKSKMVINDTFECDITNPIVIGGTVTFVALQIAYYMGFDEIILIGLDHSYVEKGEPSMSVVRHEIRDQSHFHPDYFPKGYKWQLPDLLRSEIDYRIALTSYNRAGRKIYDSTMGGKCNIFPKVDYLSLF